MNYLLDTHVFLWCLFEPEKLSQSARSTLLGAADSVCVSPISLWEISLKYALGKLELRKILPEQLLERALEAGFEILDLTPHIYATFYILPRKAADPFDRMLVWQALRQNYVLVTADRKLKKSYAEFGLRCLW